MVIGRAPVASTLGIGMFMVLGLVFLVAIWASAALGVAMLVTGTGLAISRRWRKWGLVVLAAGVVGASLGCVGLGILAWWLSSGQGSTEQWLLFGAAGFGWGALAATGILLLFAWLEVPNRWSDRRKHGNA